MLLVPKHLKVLNSIMQTPIASKGCLYVCIVLDWLGNMEDKILMGFCVSQETTAW